MSYRFTREDASLEAGLRRVACDQLDRALAEADDASSFDETVHAVRKRCKKLRGLVRLVRPAFAGYRRENAALRDAARLLAPVRDAAAAIETFDGLMAHFADEVDEAAFAELRAWLVERHRLGRAEIDAAGALADTRARLAAVRERAGGWALDTGGFDAAAGGLAKTHRRAVKAMKRARKDGDAARMHAWRKRVKYHWYHARLLNGCWPKAMKAHARAAHALSDRLGDHHDLAVLAETLGLAASPPPETGLDDRARREAFAGLLARRQAGLAADAFALGDMLLAEETDALVARWAGYWAAWRRHHGRAVHGLAA
ncbi:CHAD domain-containing protein [Aquibium sp. A9E412]|uniref:CHAD domain-containing protein n=1 Tax=Aquibium sp. A9E412 TaxID=2976767 RepID=UPI0025B21592|nr:CHAD domain-containing protein [Aquibium sp. A9E412]MDN2564969.1 CHAD domain-containing protein [Aquibium sp. A9E412]